MLGKQMSFFSFLFFFFDKQTDEFHPNKNNDGILLLEHLALFTPMRPDKIGRFQFII